VGGATIRGNSLALDAGDNAHICYYDDGPEDLKYAYQSGIEFFEHARIDSIKDVPDDQGGWVRIHFTRSLYDDVDETTHPIATYDIHRRIDNPALVADLLQETQIAVPPGGQSTQRTARETDRGGRYIMYEDRYFLVNDWGASQSPPGVWEVVASMSARQEDYYVRLAPTLGDSSLVIPYSVYYISAHTTTPAVFYDSPADSGYSVDNIAPGVPEEFAVAYNTGTGNYLTWEPPGDGDLQYYRVYRDDAPGFTPTPGNLVHSTIDTEWTDPLFDGWQVYYKVTALDYVGNESDATTTGTMTGVPDPSIKSFELRQNVPNPFNPSTTITFALPERARVKLSIYSIEGRLVTTLLDEAIDGGIREVTWSGKDGRGNPVSSGVYFYRLQAGNTVLTKKMTVLK
jgi:hypothetical protein